MLKKSAGIRKPSLKFFTSFLLIVFLLIFPKGGIKLHNMPITWGYLLLFIVGIRTALLKQNFLEKESSYSLAALIPFQAISLFSILVNGFTNTGYTLSLFLNFFLFPWLFLGVFSKYLNNTLIYFIFKWIRNGILFVAVYGIFLFLYKILTGSFLEIPMLTINYHDRNEMELVKCIDRGGIFKLFSTYNNGNLYGICLLMFIPLYNTLETSKLRKLLVKSSLILTLSRTIWAGLVFIEVIFLLFSDRSILRKIINLLSILAICGIAFFGLQYIFPFSLEFLFDRFLGNRIGQFEVLKDVLWFSRNTFEEVYEIVYLGILKSFGIFGLFCYLLAMLTPVLILIFARARDRCFAKYKSPIVIGLVGYMFVSFGDGALLLIPVMCFYWALCMIAFRLLFFTHSSSDFPSNLNCESINYNLKS